MLKVEVKGDDKKIRNFLKNASKRRYLSVLHKIGREGVVALSSATPVSTGITAKSWEYKLNKASSGYEIVWNNSNTNAGAKIAILIQYGHGTGTGGYVKGVDYINPAIRPIFKKMADEAWKAVNNG